MTDINLITNGDRLRRFKEKSKAWIDHSPTCTKIVDLDFNLQFMSSVGVESLGIDDITKYYGKPYPLEFYPQSFCNQMLRNMIKARDTISIVTQEAAVVDVNGNEVWFNSTIVPICEESENTDFFMIISIDSTRKNRAENECVQLIDELASEVGRRTLELEMTNKKHIEKCNQVEKEHDLVINKLKKSLGEIKILQGIIPICSYCKVVCNKEGRWEPIESYLANNSEIEFTHGMCPECYSNAIKDIEHDEQKE
jgi:hypothetical protein